MIFSIQQSDSGKCRLLFAGILILAVEYASARRQNENDEVSYKIEASHCGCHELQSIEDFRSGGGNTTPNDTETSLVATIRLEEFNDNVATCSKFCGHKNINASHLVILGLICQCFSGLKTFHCEEEEGEPLVNVYCIESKPEPVTEPVKSEIVEPVLSWRKPLEPLPKSSLYEMESLKEIEIFETTLSVASNATQTDTNDDGDIFTASSTSAIEKPAILVGVLLIAAVLLLVGFAIKTCVDLKRQKNNEINKRLQLSNETFTSVAFS